MRPRATVAGMQQTRQNWHEAGTWVHATCRMLLTVGLLAGATAGLSACNTLSGAGEDASALGHDVSKGATATQQAVTGNTGLATH